MKRIGYGIFMWSGSERQSQRYGYFYPDETNYAESYKLKPELDLEAMAPFLGTRVRLTVKVLEARKSGHAGDRAIGIFPSMPNADEVIEIGVGVLDLLRLDFETPCGWAIGLLPGDGREDYWLDPNILYRLHDQTVEIFVEPTTDEFSARPSVNRTVQTGMIDNGDGTMQYVGPPVKKGVRVLPNIRRLGDGFFAINPPVEGEVFDVTPLDDDQD